MKKGMLRGALFLSAAGVICKVVGAIYRVPLTNILGAEGLGAYQMVFPVYAVLLTLSSTGIPSALSKLIAEGKDPSQILKRSLLFFGGIGAIFTLLTYFFAENIAALQGNIDIASTYKALSPSIFIVSLISCFRGYCQGKRNMLPTALSQVVEQVVKLLFGLTLCSLFGSTPYEKAALATLAVTVSELIALIIVIIAYKKEKSDTIGENARLKSIIAIVFPITLSAIMLPLSKTVDGFLAVNLFGDNRSVATSLFGLYSGATESIISLPVALCYAVAVSALPELSSDKQSLEKRFRPIYITLAISAITGLLTYFSARLAVNILYFSLSEENKTILELLIEASTAQVVGLGLLQTSGAVLIANDRLYLPCIHLAVGIVLKIILTFVLVPNGYGVFGLSLADTFIYLFVGISDLVSVIALNKTRQTDISIKLKRIKA